MAYNINRKVSDVFEFGNTYNKYGDEFVEAHRLALWMTGVKQEENWNVTASKVDFFFMRSGRKGASKLGLHQGVVSSTIQSDLLSEGLLYKMKEKVLEFGAVRKSILKKFGIKQGHVCRFQLGFDHDHA